MGIGAAAGAAVIVAPGVGVSAVSVGVAGGEEAASLQSETPLSSKTSHGADGRAW